MENAEEKVSARQKERKEVKVRVKGIRMEVLECWGS